MSAPSICRTQLNNRGNSFPFVDPATRLVDCNVAKASEALELFSGLQFTAKDLRVQANQLSGPTGNVFARRVFTAQGMVAGNDFFIANGQSIAGLRVALRSGWYACGFVDYGKLNDLGAPTGDRHYRGIHAIGLWGWRRTGTSRLVWDHDPLFDGRRAAIPYGRQHVFFDPIQQALGEYAGLELWSGWAVRIPL